MKSVKEIIKDYLIEKGYDGLYSAGNCACKIDDLIPCQDSCENCCAGYLLTDEDSLRDAKIEGWDFVIGEQKTKEMSK